MSMEMTAWNQMYRSMHTNGDDHRPFSRVTVRRIMVFARPLRSLLVGFLILSVVAAVLAVATPVLAGRVVDAIVQGSAYGTVLVLAVIIAVVALLDAGTGLVNRWLSARIGENLILDLRTRVFDHVQKMPIAFFTRTRTGALVSRLNNDVIGAQRAFSGTLSGVVSNLVTLLLTLVVMLGISWQITLLALLLLPIFVLPARRMGTRLARLQREAAAHNAAMSTQMTERFSAPGATLIKLFGRPDHESAEFALRAGRVRDIGVRSAMVQTVFVTALTLVSALALALVYGLGGFYALRGQLDAGSVVTLALLLTRLYAPLTALASARVDIMSAVVSFERVFEILDLDPLITDKPDARAVPEGPVTVEFDDVRFAYPSADKVSLASLEDVSVLDARGGEEVLHGVSFRAEPGHMVALVGSSGAGKSTIAQLVSRLYDVDSGAVRIGDVDVRDLTAESIRRTVGMVTQDGHLFHETLRSNLTLAHPDATEEEIWSALRRARLEELVLSLPDGLDTVVGERGYRFSGGERQRVTIARLLLARPTVVVLDEATASLDSTSEAAVQEALAEALEGRTSIVIAHRLSTIRAADLILVIENGRVVERGTHTELLANSGRYSELYRTQFDEPVRA
ncbi:MULTISPECIES: ABC transporter ATP-binding protein [unclassified Rhodococcus (in: high G+C Gram-positive bacteria)]|uniref:ABC transporter ATP-binding protein n=1 Tax=unclassified Rhodococcus (in: high G+C Gram-positive bacteria) TaxID=192944 RepID=UPI0006FA1DD4|nr:MULTISPECIES: ABC transporter ATP-binding protein [unclassified Rhodococcus (in: high G+C Gram-positive bacteria)]KQU35992.1 ABC transporter [Rhodococcus sp. Leaf225]KQU48540.1 ABC transporter [Rhodococcus sp. Leaf258]MBY6677237.1 ABC transporter ATP-binding protein [Rhodococcus sp. BP-332]MDQ1182687.1 ATP-binding cassette subfamily B protein [Rhodococcus sp. SORGH_AS_0301]MDQ1199758.1 ATP-binding cassette subfamily B protein [Rhodococcus sp. SORGH_AS_0303]